VVVTVAAVVIFLATYVVMAVGRLPGFRIDRAGAALLGAALMVAVGAITPAGAFAAIDAATIALLLGMMVVVANLRLSGFFRLVTDWVTRHARHPLALLAGVVAVTGVLSAFLVNDAVCLAMTPLVADVVVRMRRDPVPYLLAVAMSSNAGSVATITGNPQNMIIGSLSRLPYAHFAAALAPVALVSLAVVFGLIALIYRAEFSYPIRSHPAREEPHYHRPLVLKSVAVLVLMIAAFFAGAPVAEVAVLGGAYLLLTRRVRPVKVYALIDWPLLVMFAGLFVVVAALEQAVLGPRAIAAISGLDLSNVPVLALLTAVLSQLVSNVPAVLVLRPFVAPLADPDRAWLTIAMASTLAGNLTIVGSVANLIVVEQAKKAGIAISFRRYVVVGVPLALVTLVLGTAWLTWF
jgi:Na+/H+ antiporter NhaD/arsenite permease-like protein